MTRTVVSPDLVGREAQLGRLDEALSRAEVGLPGTVLLPGEAGVGKTRLLREFLAVARDRGATALLGACVEISAGDLPFVPFRSVLRQMLRDRSEQGMAALLGPTWQHLHVLLPELAPPHPADEGLEAPHAFEVMAAIVDVLVRERPLVLAVDDAQWADQSTLQLLRFLSKANLRQPLLLVVAYRAEDLPPDPPRRKAFEELSRSADDVVTVSPLTVDQVATLVDHIGVELSASSRTRLQQRCGGLPFLVEELVSAEHEGITRGIPRRVRDVVRLRLGALSEDGQLVVAVVAVAARPLHHRVLASAAHLPTRRFAGALDEALRARLLVEDSAERTYGFRHDVAREIVHEHLLTTSRLELHLRLAVSLQADLPVDAYAGRLCEVAHHWLQSDANEEHALRASLLAARASTRAYAHPEAARQYENVVRLWGRVPDAELIVGADLVTLSVEAAEAGHWAGDTESALGHIDRALAATDDAEVLGVLHERRTYYSWLESGHLERGRPELLERIGSAATRERMRASDLMQSGQYAESVAVAESALALARSAGATADEIRASIILGVGLSFTGRPEIGVQTIESARARALDQGTAEDVVAAVANLAFALLGDGQVERAAEVALTGLDEAIERGVGAADGALLAGNAAEALTRVGRLQEAARVVQNGLDHHPPPALETFLVLTGAEIDILRGRLPEAAQSLASIAEGAMLDDLQFQQQLRAVEAELQLWDPTARAGTLGDLRSGLGSLVAVESSGDDVPLAARLLWLGVRADADARSLAEIADDQERLRAVVTDGMRLSDRGEALATAQLSAGGRRQLRVFLSLIAGEMSRLAAAPDPDVWEEAAAADNGDPYLRAYALWRLGSALRDVRRRREGGLALREAYRLAKSAGIMVVADAVTSAGNSLGIRIDEPVPGQRTGAATARPFNLTPKEIDVLTLLVQGQTNRRIATALRMTEKTASVHVSHILAKLSVKSRGEAVARAYEVGLVRAPISTGD